MGFRSRTLFGAARRFHERRIHGRVGFLVVLPDGGGQRDGSHVAAEFTAQAIAELLDGEVALDLAADGEADGAGLFGADNGDGVGLFGDADAGTVARAELGGE